MSVHATPPSATSAPTRYDEGYLDDDRGYGWVAFAGVLLILVGTLNFIEGIAAISNSHFFVNGNHYIVGSLNTWGWVALCLGVVQWVIGLGVFAKNQFSRWAGVLILGLNSIAQLMMIPAYPFWSLTVFTLDILAMFGLIAYGRRLER